MKEFFTILIVLAISTNLTRAATNISQHSPPTVAYANDLATFNAQFTSKDINPFLIESIKQFLKRVLKVGATYVVEKIIEEIITYILSRPEIEHFIRCCSSSESCCLSGCPICKIVKSIIHGLPVLNPSPDTSTPTLDLRFVVIAISVSSESSAKQCANRFQESQKDAGYYFDPNAAKGKGLYRVYVSKHENEWKAEQERRHFKQWIKHQHDFHEYQYGINNQPDIGEVFIHI